MKLVFATNNLHKLKEVQEMVSDTIQIISLKEIGCHEDIEETAITLEGNAQLKADYITEKYGYDCFADDTGLEVDFLNGEPGVYSARYAGEHRSAEENMEKLLRELSQTSEREAQFRTAIALNWKQQRYLFEGVCKGEILQQKSGTKGFGYDPIFKPLRYSTSFAEMSSEEKNKISHRGLAIQTVSRFFK